MLLWFEYLVLFFLGAAAMLTLCYVFGFKRIAVSALCVNSALGGVVILICMLCGVSAPGWLVALTGLIGTIATFILIFI